MLSSQPRTFYQVDVEMMFFILSTEFRLWWKSLKFRAVVCVLKSISHLVKITVIKCF